MKERITGEINSSMNKGVEFASKTVNSAILVIQSIGRSYLGETILERSEGRWVPHRVKPGIRDLIRIRR